MTPDDDQPAQPPTQRSQVPTIPPPEPRPQAEIALADEHALIALRRAKLEQLRQAGPAFPNDFRRNALAAELQGRYGALDNEALEAKPVEVSVAGRMLAQRVMGKASFATLQDMSGHIPLFVQRDAIGEALYASFQTWDVGDIVGATGTLFK
ncbi:MAG: OB-fold nucleic acid binding domain-containing protein, partial [Candidatus Macondimonas sp.]